MKLQLGTWGQLEVELNREEASSGPHAALRQGSPRESCRCGCDRSEFVRLTLNVRLICFSVVAKEKGMMTLELSILISNSKVGNTL